MTHLRSDDGLTPGRLPEGSARYLTGRLGLCASNTGGKIVECRWFRHDFADERPEQLDHRDIELYRSKLERAVKVGG